METNISLTSINPNTFRSICTAIDNSVLAQDLPLLNGDFFPRTFKVFDVKEELKIPGSYGGYRKNIINSVEFYNNHLISLSEYYGSDFDCLSFYSNIPKKKQKVHIYEDSIIEFFSKPQNTTVFGILSERDIAKMHSKVENNPKKERLLMLVNMYLTKPENNQMNKTTVPQILKKFVI